jgi:hypothetical protein
MSTVKIHKNIVDPTTINQLIDFFYTDKTGLDVRPDNISKTIDWSKDGWDKITVKHILDQVLDLDYDVEYWMGIYRADFRKGETYFPVHADSGLGKDKQAIYKNILIPLALPTEPGIVGTVFFDNYWTGPMAKFSKQPYHKFSYNLPNRHGTKTYVQDLRVLKEQAISNPESIVDWNVDQEFIDTLDYLIPLRETRQNHPISDYTDLVNVHDQPFPEDIRKKYLDHIPPEDLHGMSFDQCWEWSIGDVITWDRTQLHATAGGPTGKLFITIFTVNK